MPELFRIFGVSFLLEKTNPLQVNIKSDNGTARFDVMPMKLIENNGIKRKDIYMAETIIQENADLISSRWSEFIGK